MRVWTEEQKQKAARGHQEMGAMDKIHGATHRGGQANIIAKCRQTRDVLTHLAGNTLLSLPATSI